MQVQKISNNNTNFQHSIGAVKNTFKRQMLIAKADHLEAKARLHYMKFEKAEKELEKFENPFSSVKETWQLIKTFSSMTYHKLKSADYISESKHCRLELNR